MAKEKNTPEEQEQVQNEQVSKTEEKETPKTTKKRVIVSSAEYWDFDEEPIFVGHYESDVIREKDEVNGDGKAGDIIGYNFISEKDGELHIISNSHQIQKALELTSFQKEFAYEIEFKGKGVNSKNQPFNRFKVSIYDTPDRD